MKVEVAVLNSPSITSLLVSVDVIKASELERSDSDLNSYVKVEVAVLSSPSLIRLLVSVDVKQH